MLACIIHQLKHKPCPAAEEEGAVLLKVVDDFRDVKIGLLEKAKKFKAGLHPWQGFLNPLKKLTERLLTVCARDVERLLVWGKGALGDLDAFKPREFACLGVFPVKQVFVTVI